MHCDGENLGRKETGLGWSEAKGGQRWERAQAYLAVVRRTNRLTMLFSKVLKYYEERVGMCGQAWTVTSRAHLSPFPLGMQRDQSRDAAHTHTHGGLRFTSSADEGRLPTKGVRGRFPGVSHVPAVSERSSSVLYYNVPTFQT